MVAMAVTSSSIGRERLALDLAVERFRSRAVAELWRLKDRLPRREFVAWEDADHGPAISAEPWEQARRRHLLARQGLIPWPTEPILPAGPVTALCGEQPEPEPRAWSAEPRAA